MKKVLLISGLLIPLTASSWSLMGSYDDCILDNMGSATTKIAVYDIRNSCGNKFPIKRVPARKTKTFPKEVLKKIDGSTGMGTQGYGNERVFKGTIFNNNKDWEIISLTIRIYDKDTEEHRDYIAPVSHYESPQLSSYRVEPLTNGFFHFTPYNLPKNYSWGMVSGKGYKN